MSTTHPSRCARVVTGLLAMGLVAGLAGASMAAPDLKAGKALYNKYCMACHTPEGKPRMPGPLDLSSKAAQGKLNDETMAQALLKGKGRMPAFGTMGLTPPGAADLVGYVRTLGK